MRREEQLSLKLHQHILSKIQMQPALIDQAHSNLMRYHQQTQNDNKQIRVLS